MSLTTHDVTSLIRDVETGRESDVRHPAHPTSEAGEPPHLVWGLGGHPTAVGVTPGGLEFRSGEYWASRWSDLEVTDEPWVLEDVERQVAALRASMRVASERQERLARRASTPGQSVADLVIGYLEAPSPDLFERTLSQAVLWVDHRDDDEAVVAGVDRQLGGAAVTAAWTDDGRLTIRGPQGERTVAPTSRDVTLRALATLLGAGFELRHWVGGAVGDTAAIVGLPAEAWRSVAAARSARALDAQFRRIHARSKVFG